MNSRVQETIRLVDICNACRYCEGYCPVFTAIPELSPQAGERASDMHYLANLCHNCTACYHACQYKPPHEFDVNLPRLLNELRTETYAEFAWPKALAVSFHARGPATVLVLIVLMWVFLAVGAMLAVPDAFSISHSGPGAFYAVLPHNTIVTLAVTSLGFAVIAMALSARRFWRRIDRDRGSVSASRHFSALNAVARMRHLSGGRADGCNNGDTVFSMRRRYFHQLTLWGFVLCLAATTVATIYELLLGRLSPFPYTSLPVVLGTLGGIGLIVGPLGLIWTRRHNEDGTLDNHVSNNVLSALLIIISVTGFAVMFWRETDWMGVLLLLHLSIVLTFFVTMPYSKFVHGLYRYLALLKHADP